MSLSRKVQAWNFEASGLGPVMWWWLGHEFGICIGMVWL